MSTSRSEENLLKMNYCVVICDDESYIANTTATMLRMQNQWEMDIHVFTNSSEALAFSVNHRVDLLIADICIPQLDGLSLMRAVTERWPTCQSVMLTAHSEFDYVYEAIQYDQVSYVLKCNGHEAMMAAVTKRMDAMENSLHQVRKMERIQKQVQSALPYLQREWLLDLLHNNYSAEELQQTQKTLSLPLDMSKPFSAVLFLIQAYDHTVDFWEQTRNLELLAASLKHSLPKNSFILSVPMSKQRILCLMQDGNGANFTAPQMEGALDLLQQSALLELKMPFSAVYTSYISSYSVLQPHYSRMCHLHAKMAAGQEEVWLLSTEATKGELSVDSNQQAISQIKTWRHAFENGDPRTDELFENLLNHLVCSGPEWNNISREFYLQFALGISAVMQHAKTSQNAYDESALTGLLRIDMHQDVLTAAAYLRNTVDFIRTEQVSEASGKLNETVLAIQTYVEEHLHEDFSISVLAEQVGLNTSYLSRLFRKATGETIITYITRARIRRASELLEDTSLPIKQISQQLGFWNPAYFSYYFKKNTGITPSEYRDMHQR